MRLTGEPRLPSRSARCLAQEMMGLLCDLGSGGLAGADGPDRLVGQGKGVGPAGEGGVELSFQDFEKVHRPGARSESRPRQMRGAQAVAVGRHRLVADEFVALAVVTPPLAVATEHPGATGVCELWSGDVTGVGAFVLDMDVLATPGQGAAGEDLGHRRQQRGS